MGDVSDTRKQILQNTLEEKLKIFFKLISQERYEEAQEKAFQYANDRYDVGLTNAFDFNQAKVRYENAQREVLRAKYDYIFKLKVVELYFGVPVRDLKF
mgnify:FL=1